MERIPRPGEFYRHFKNKLYQVVAVAEHTETGEQMAVYQALYGSFRTYVRPLSMFVSEVDHQKYPDVKQKYRFEKVNLETIQSEEMSSDEKPQEIPNKNLLAFVDAGTYEEKLKIVKERKDDFSEAELLAICEYLEVGREDSRGEEQYYAVKRFLELQVKYDGLRLR